jgi:hypothetical protein
MSSSMRKRLLKIAGLVLLYSSLAYWTAATLALDFPGPAPGEAKGRFDGDRIVLENEVIVCTWTVVDGHLKPNRITNKLTGRAVDLSRAECFQIVLADSPLPDHQTMAASDLTVMVKPELAAIRPSDTSPKLAEQSGGQSLGVELKSDDGNLKAQWQAILRDGSNYLRQHVRLTTTSKPEEIIELLLWDVTVPDAQVAGAVEGSPVTAGNMFFACEHPMSWSRVLQPAPDIEQPKRLQCGYPLQATLAPGESLAQNSIVGVVPPGQLRRGFLYYLERERAHPYRPFLHYNNGSEIGCEYWQRKGHGKPNEADRFRQDQQRIWLDNIGAFGRELVTGRGVVMDSFVHDFEWDDETAVWQFHRGYPDGFKPAQRAAQQFGAEVGVWLSPWGGYPGKPARIESGHRQGFETTDKGLSLAGPRYYWRVHAACTGMIRKYGVNYFKFDGFGAGNNQAGPGRYASDVEGLLRLIAELRGLDPDVFVNPSTGSWPSPFWLLWADSIWRQGSDTNIAGKGSQRQQWITYRDGEVYRGILARAPLYPINSLMIHGIYINHLPLFGNPYDPNVKKPTYDPADIVAEIRSFFGTGTNLQELYVAPDLMTPETWDALAEAASWSRENSDVLVDTHWVGGDPAAGKVYGWASWSKRKGILVLRNPDDKAARISLDPEMVFELPEGAARQYELKSPWKEDADKAPLPVTAGRTHTFELQPFEVLCFEAMPVRQANPG